MNKVKKIFSILLICIIMINAQKSMTIKVDALDIAQEEQKVYSNANINDDFAPDSVILVMSNLKSLSCQTYSQSDFSEVGVNSIRYLTSSIDKNVKMLLSSDNENSIMYNNIRVDVNNNVNLKEYNQVICLELSTSGKENVLQVIEELEKREDVIYVGPNYYWSLGSDDLDSTDYENFGLQNAANIIQLSYAWDELERWQLSTVKGGN